ncbi:hypothetical protein BU16DRAFT_122381 [Lophium mytilinum]|uniref:Prion-inhibition and propagation HeLo domain-containing protein n=1 Tax=Lophium mytilinum TaxID=390894 RepID=A0A6A6QIT5_9PEZI|nr:hypothetical protein BU16DRAFT_122381 [Lophium mytilinum]
MEAVGLSLALIQVFDTTTKASISLALSIRSAKEFGKDAEKLSVRIADEIERIRQLRQLLLERDKIFPDATLFAQLSPESQENLVALIYVVTGPLFGECKELWSTYLAKSQSIKDLDDQEPLGTLGKERDLDDLVKAFEAASVSIDYQQNIGLRAKMKWAVSDKVRAIELVDELSDTTRRIKDDIELFCFPLGILNSKASVLRQDTDAQKIGWAANAELIGLIQSCITSGKTCEVNSNDVEVDTASSDNRSIATAYLLSESTSGPAVQILQTR